MSSAVASFTLTNACSWQEDQSLPMPFRGAALPLDQQNNSTACQHDFQAMLLDAEQLNSAAEKIVRHSCQEDWLLQPYISDIQEYRYGSFSSACSNPNSMLLPMYKQDGAVTHIQTGW